MGFWDITFNTNFLGETVVPYIKQFNIKWKIYVCVTGNEIQMCKITSDIKHKRILRKTEEGL